MFQRAYRRLSDSLSDSPARKSRSDSRKSASSVGSAGSTPRPRRGPEVQSAPAVDRSSDHRPSAVNLDSQQQEDPGRSESDAAEVFHDTSPIPPAPSASPASPATATSPPPPPNSASTPSPTAPPTTAPAHPATPMLPVLPYSPPMATPSRVPLPPDADTPSTVPLPPDTPALTRTDLIEPIMEGDSSSLAHSPTAMPHAHEGLSQGSPPPGSPSPPEAGSDVTEAHTTPGSPEPIQYLAVGASESREGPSGAAVDEVGDDGEDDGDVSDSKPLIAKEKSDNSRLSFSSSFRKSGSQHSSTKSQAGDFDPASLLASPGASSLAHGKPGKMADDGDARPSRCCGHRCVLYSLAFVAVVATAASLALHFLVLTFIRSSVEEGMVLRPELYQWRAPEAETSLSLYLYNITNPATVRVGGQAKVTQLGPWVYSVKVKRDRIFWLPNGTVTFSNHVTFTFDPEQSALPETQMVTTIDIPTVAVRSLAGPAASSVLAWFLELDMENDVIVTRTARQLLWGYDSPSMGRIREMLVNLENYDSMGFLKTVLDNMPKQAGYLYGQNDTSGIPLNVYTGAEDFSRFNQVASWNSMANLPFWATKTANTIRGTDGSMFAPFLERSRRLAFFCADLFRVFDLTLSGLRHVSGIDVWRYVIADDQFSNTTMSDNGLGSSYPVASRPIPEQIHTASTSTNRAPENAVQYDAYSSSTAYNPTEVSETYDESTSSSLSDNLSTKDSTIFPQDSASDYKLFDDDRDIYANWLNKSERSSALPTSYSNDDTSTSSANDQDTDLSDSLDTDSVFGLTTDDRIVKREGNDSSFYDNFFDDGDAEPLLANSFFSAAPAGGFCTPRCLPQGLYSLEPVTYGVPIYISLPHLLGADPELLNQVEGMSPREDEHRPYFDIDPVTGAAVRQARRYQVNLRLQDGDQPLVPLMWIDSFSVVSEGEAASIQTAALAYRAVQTLRYFLVAGAGLAVALLMLLLAVRGCGDALTGRDEEGGALSPGVGGKGGEDEDIDDGSSSSGRPGDAPHRRARRSPSPRLYCFMCRNYHIKACRRDR